MQAKYTSRSATLLSGLNKPESTRRGLHAGNKICWQLITSSNKASKVRELLQLLQWMEYWKSTWHVISRLSWAVCSTTRCLVTILHRKRLMATKTHWRWSWTTAALWRRVKPIRGGQWISGQLFLSPASYIPTEMKAKVFKSLYTLAELKWNELNRSECDFSWRCSKFS